MSTPSPAERYAAFKTSSTHPQLEAFRAGLSFDLDDFQRGSCASLEDGGSVLVAAPTGAGKTVVAEFAVYLAMQQRRAKVFYTTPMKALSNQKFNEFVDEYGASEVGLLTGDTNINSSARIVVMTTEVLRNMLYADSDLLTDLAFVVMDEVHFLGDRFRGAVWEEVIIHLPADACGMVSLSATVSNAEEFGDWLQAVRGDTAVIVSEDRPVPLEQHVLVRTKLVDLFDSSGVITTTRVNPELVQLAASGGRSIQNRSTAGRRGRDRGGYHRPPPHEGRMPREDLVALLDGKHLLPAIFFIFSRVGCDQAVRQVLRSGHQADGCRGAQRDPPHRRGAQPHHGRRGPRRARLLGVARGARARRRRPPRRHAARLQGGRRGAVPEEARQGRLRHRDARARHQHARPHRRDGEAGEVQRRGQGSGHAGGVHPAHRAVPAAAASTSRVTRSSSGSRASTRRPSPRWPPGAATRSTPASGRRTTWPST